MSLKSQWASWVCAICAVLASQSVYAQGFGRGGGNPDEFFNRIDTNGNQQLDPEELQASPMRRMFEAGGRDLSKPITKAEFTEITQQFMQRFRGGGRGRRDGEGGDPGAGPTSPSAPTPPNSDPPGTAAPPAAIPGVPQSGTPAPGGPAPAPANNSLGGPPRVAAEAGSKPTTTRKRSATLPEEYVAKDTNGDGQLGLYEWPRTDFATFHKLDLNNDGFVTAAELLRKDKPRAAAPSVNPGASTVAMGGAGGPPAAGGGWGSPARSEPIRQPGSGESGGGGGGGDRSRGGGPGRGSMPPAERAFTALDIDKNGSLSEEEWQRSVSVKAQFEREGITLTFPLSKADFESKYPQRR